MQIDFPTIHGITLAILDLPDTTSVYPTRQLAKGIVMSVDGKDLTEEAVGFGLPVVKHGIETFFPGAVKLAGLPGQSDPAVSAIYSINLVERVVQNGRTIEDKPLLYFTKNLLAALIRNFPLLRKPLTALSTKMRSQYDWQTTYVPAQVEGRVEVRIVHPPGSSLLEFTVNLSGLGARPYTEAVIMNEQGGAAFDLYHDSSDLHLAGSQIGAWDEINAERASFASSRYGIAFSAGRVAEARLFRGREVIDRRLAWSGFGYSVLPNVKSLTYAISLERFT